LKSQNNSKISKKMKKLSLILLLLFCSLSLFSQQLAFPGAEGFGKYATGGRGGIVIEVTNLNDAGPGSLRAAIENSSTRTIVFKVSGTIYLKSTLNINYGNVTIAGQTAPGDGITLAGYNFRIKANNVIIRYIRARLGDKELQEADAFTCTGQSNIIIDHCSFSWSVDEAASAYSNQNFTMQWCIISESLYNSIHSKGAHGYGGIWGGSRASFHHNLFAHNTSRNPRFNGARYNSGSWQEIVDYRNNVIYNWGFNSAYGGEPSEIDGIKASINMVGNYYKAGPATSTGSIRYRIVSPDPQGTEYSYWYIDSNYVEGYPNATQDNWTYGVQNVTDAVKEQIKSTTPFSFDITTHHTAEEAYAAVLLNAGATLPRRDTIDRRIVYEVEHGVAFYGGSFGAGKGIIDSQDDVGGWPRLFSAPAPADRDHDGMPDQWEIENGLNPDNPADRNGDANADGYTNLEEYLNSIVTFPNFIYPPEELNAELTDIREITLTWTNNATGDYSILIERKSTGVYEIIDTLPAETKSYIDTALQYETTYTYRIRAFSLFDTSIYSNESAATTLSETGLPLPASLPGPSDGKNYVKTSQVLTWKKGVGSNSHLVYFGTTNPPALIAEIYNTFYQPDELEWGKTYYWRVDEKNAYGTTEGPVWSFTTRESLSPRMVGYWKLDQGSPTPDSSGYNNHGNLIHYNPPFYSTDAAINNSLIFNGIDQYVEIPHNWVFDFEKGPFTISFWMKQMPDEVNSTVEYRYVIKGSHNANSELNHSGKRYEVYYKPEKTSFRFAVDDDAVKSEVSASPANFVTGKWVHVAAIRDTLEKKIKLYANAVLESEADDLTGDISQEENLYFGYCVDFGSWFKGKLDDIRLFNYALTNTEIDALYKLGPHESKVIENEFVTSNELIFPNPSSDKIRISLINPASDNIIFYLHDISGKIVLSKTLQLNNTNAFDIDISTLPCGTYIATLITGQHSSHSRLIIMR
jgi:hypothetical protein